MSIGEGRTIYEKHFSMQGLMVRASVQADKNPSIDNQWRENRPFNKTNLILQKFQTTKIKFEILPFTKRNDLYRRV